MRRLVLSSLLIMHILLSAGATHAEEASQDMYPPIPEKVTSFGAAVLDGAIYVYGGHTGGAHSYSNTSSASTLRRLDLQRPNGWEALGSGPGLQGLALVAHGGKLYRIGGFLAKNAEGEEHDLWSQDSVAIYHPQEGQWSKGPSLPEPRSSFDAAVLGDTIYVVGGWKLAGNEDTKWHQTAYALDLSEEQLCWKALPAPPFRRRALSVAAHDGKLYVIGGMQPEEGPTTRVDVFDPASQRWTEGPSLQGEAMEGFGSAAYALNGRLYVSTYSGTLQRLSRDGSLWEVVAETPTARFFHRMLPVGHEHLVLIGGASMETGKFEELDVLTVR